MMMPRLLQKALLQQAKKWEKVVAVLTNMSQPLGYKVGNFLEIEEALDCLEGKGPKDVMELTYWLGAWMLVLGGKAKDVSEGKSLCEEAIESKAALNLFYRNVVRQGGDLEEMQKKEDPGAQNTPLLKLELIKMDISLPSMLKIGSQAYTSE